MRYSKILIAAVVLLNVGFTVAVLLAAIRGASVPDSLVVAWFGWTTGELWLLASIKKAKVKKEGKRHESEIDKS